MKRALGILVGIAIVSALAAPTVKAELAKKRAQRLSRFSTQNVLNFEFGQTSPRYFTSDAGPNKKVIVSDSAVQFDTVAVHGSTLINRSAAGVIYFSFSDSGWTDTHGVVRGGQSITFDNIYAEGLYLWVLSADSGLAYDFMR